MPSSRPICPLRCPDVPHSVMEPLCVPGGLIEMVATVALVGVADPGKSSTARRETP